MLLRRFAIAAAFLSAMNVHAADGPTYTVFVSNGAAPSKLTVSSTGDAVLQAGSKTLRFKLVSGSVKGRGFTLKSADVQAVIGFNAQGEDFLCADCVMLNLADRWTLEIKK